MEILTSVGETPDSFLKNVIIPLAWFRLGSLNEILEWDITTIHRVARMSSDSGFMKTFMSFTSPETAAQM